MIKSLTIENFFSFGKSEKIILNEGTNILVGINGSGKSNFIKAIQLLKAGISEKNGLERLLLGHWGGFDAIKHLGHNSEEIKLVYEFDKEAISRYGMALKQNLFYVIKIKRLGLSNYRLEEEVFSKDEKNNERTVYLKKENGSWKINKDKQNGQVQLKPYNEKIFNPQELILAQVADPDSQNPLFMLRKAIEDFSIYEYFDTTLSGPIKQLSSFSTETKLFSNGANLVQILNTLKNNHTLHFDKIEGFIREINPNFKDIGFLAQGSKILMTLREQQLHKAISIEHISDGTLRFLCLLAILYNPEQGKLICIDEPEIGLHPDMIDSIAKGIKYAAQNGTQFFIATHSPLLLNAFDLEDIWIFEKNTANETKMSFKTEEDFEAWTGNFLAGQMWLRGQLGGVRW